MSRTNKIVCIFVVSVSFVVMVCAGILFAKYYTSGKNDVAEQGIQENTEEKSGSLKEQEQENTMQTKTSDEYTDIMNRYMSSVSGNCQWGYNIYGENVSYISNSFAAPSASVIKLFIMEYAFDLVEKGKLSLSDTVSGQSVESLITNMITWSDNSSTNILIDKFGMDNMNAFFAQKGYSDTSLQRKMLDTAAQSAGRENYTSVRDVMSFLDKLYQNRDAKPCSQMLGIMKKQQVSTKIRRNFPSGVVIANKTGELYNVENDVGIIFSDSSDFALVFMCSSVGNSSGARSAIADAAYEMYRSIEDK